MGIDTLIQPAPSSEPQPQELSGKWYYILALALLGTYLNAAAYGFQYPAGADYNFFLPLANWLRDPSLYPGDALRDAFPHVQTFYWPVVAMLSRHYGTEHILFGFFLITKLIFFSAIGLLLFTRVRSRLLVVCIVAAIALSGMMNGQTPIGGTIILDEISEHAALGVAMAFFTSALLVEKKWRSAAIAGGLVVYVDALPFVHMLPALALFAAIDWREHKRRVISAAFIGACVSLPWFIHFRRSFLSNYPGDYVSVLLIHYPLHITLRWTPISQILEAASLLLATVSMCFLARKAGINNSRRLELLGISFFFTTALGCLAGWFWLTPSAARFMLQRADALLIPCAFLLVQIYGAGLLEARTFRKPASTSLLAVSAVLLPLDNSVTIVLFLAIIFWLDPRERLERFLVFVFGRFWKFVLAVPISRIAAGLCGLGILTNFVFLLPSTDQLWNFKIPPEPGDTACYGAQLWARNHTPRDATFLVPPDGCGFRVLSDRASWGEWSDGNAMYFYPEFADTFRKRVQALDPSPVPQGTGIVDSLTEVYKNQSWDRIRAVAAENHLDYILQYKDSSYPSQPVYANEVFAIYKAK